MFATSVGTWLALAVAGAFAALVVGFLAQRRETRRRAAVEVVAAGAGDRDRTRLSA